MASYCEHRADGKVGYYADGAPSTWHGTGAAVLGLQGAVKRQDLVAALEGRLPDGADLSARGNRQDDRRLGVDLTFSAPKSISLAALAGGDERLLKAHDDAVRKALDFVECEVVTARRGRSGVEVEHTGSLMAATYRHEDSRPVNGHVDPQLHSHCIVVNATQRSDGQWAALDLNFGEHSVLMHTADAVYKSELALSAQRLGYDIRVTENGFELVHITDAQIDRFSQRKGQIDMALEARGLTRETADATDRAHANLNTRESKSQDGKYDQQWQWRTDARDAGVSLDRPNPRDVASPDLATEAVKSATRHLSERETVFSKDEARLEALKAGMGGVTIDMIAAALEAGAGGLLDVGGGQLTTRDALTREAAILQSARAGAGQATPLMTADVADDYIKSRELAQGFRYSDGQREALMLSLTSPDRVVGIVGAAGAGKTTSMSGTAEAARAQGYEVVGIAPSAAASHELKSAGADDTRTLASLLASKQTEGQNRVYILDEAGMVSGRDMEALLHRVESENARLLMVGDPRQLSSVEAGSPFAHMLEISAIQYVTIDEIQRQRDPALREIAQAFAKGEAAQGAALARPYMHEVEIPKAGKKRTTQEKRTAIAEAVSQDYLSRDAGMRDKTLIVSGTNDLRRQINEKVREGLKEQGVVSRDSVTVTALDKAGLTREKATHAESYKPGMVVRLEEGRGRDRHTVEYRVMEVKGNTIAMTNREGDTRDWNPARDKPAGVYQPRDLEVSPGDKIVFRENQKGVDRIRNGESATIDRIENGQAIARLDSGKEIALDPTRGQTVDYGWCRTIHTSQGATVDHVVVGGEASRVATAQTAYVAASRERDTLKVYTDHPQTLEKTWARFAEREHALSAAKDRPVPNLESLKDLRAKAAAELGRHGDLSKARESHESQSSGPTRTGHSAGNARERGDDFSLSR